MGIIKRNHSTNFYEWPIGEERKHDSLLKWETTKGQPMVVYHPSLNFDPISNLMRQIKMLGRDDSIYNWEKLEIQNRLERRYIPGEQNTTPILHEEIKANFNFFDYLEPLLTAVERNFKITVDELLWYNTGYWAARDAKYSYIGLSEKSAFDLWTKSSNLILFYVASNPSTLLEFKLDKREENIFYLNIYYANRFVVFPDLIDGMHKSLEETGKWKVLRTEKGDHSTIFESKYNNGHRKNNISENIFQITLPRVIPLNEPPRSETDWLYAVAMNNTFFKIGNNMKKSEGFAIVTRNGGWLREDFHNEKRYHVIYSEVRKLENCYVASLVVDEIKEKDSDNEILLKNFLNDPDLSSIHNLLKKPS